MTKQDVHRARLTGDGAVRRRRRVSARRDQRWGGILDHRPRRAGLRHRPRRAGLRLPLDSLPAQRNGAAAGDREAE